MSSRTPRAQSVLVVDDDWDIRSTVELVLQQEGWTVYTAENGRAALELLHRIPTPALILLDTQMPVMDGPTLLTHLRADPALAEIPVVLMADGVVAQEPWMRFTAPHVGGKPS